MEQVSIDPSELVTMSHASKAPEKHNQIHDHVKPSLSYASLIAQAINSAPEKRITLNGIYQYISENYEYYKYANNGWQVRFTL